MAIEEPGATACSVTIVQADNLAFLRGEPAGAYRLIYVDPPFNTGAKRELRRLRTVRDERGDRTGFGGARYLTTEVGRRSYEDRFDDYLAFLAPRLAEAWRVLAPDGSLFVHLDPRESHYVKVFLDGLCGRAAFQNEIVWAYDYGARTRRRWPAKHDVILWYAKDPDAYVFRYDEIDRIPYLAPSLVGAEKARRGKTPTDVWWQTIAQAGGRERTGYPTQKPLAILRRIVRVHSEPGDAVLDFFAGSGTTGEAAVREGRRAVLVDESPDAVRVMSARLAFAAPRVIRPDSAAAGESGTGAGAGA